MSYIGDVAREMKKVTWPTVSEINHFTWIVILAVIFFSLYFGVVDFGFDNLVKWILTLSFTG